MLRLVLIALLAVSASAQPEPVVPKGVLTRLERLAKDLARKKREAEVAVVVDVLRDLGRDTEALEKLESALGRAIGRAKKRAKNPKAEARKARDAAARIGRLLDDASKADRARLARAALALDSDLEAAHVALGHVRHDGRWTSPLEAARAERRGAIQAALARARRLPVKLTVKKSEDPIFAFLGREAVAVSYRGFTLHSDVGEGKARALLTAVLRATAFSAFLRNRPLALPDAIRGRRAVLIEKTASFGAVLDWLKKRGAMTAKERADVAEDSWVYLEKAIQPGFVARYLREYETFANTFRFMAYDLSWSWAYTTKGDVQPCLRMGHVSWVCLAYLGIGAPPLRGEDKTQGGPRYADAMASAEGQRILRLKGAGLAGTRQWLRYLAGRRADPAWSHSMVDDEVKMTPLDVLKSTYVVEYLQESGRLEELLRSSTLKGRGSKRVRAVMEAALGESVPAFEERWRRWFVPGRREGIAQRLTPQPVKRVDPAVRRVLAHLNRIRKSAFDYEKVGEIAPVEVDASLSAGALAHARYLNKNPAQAAAWPDAHEEFPDRPGFTPMGSWAGGNSVIAPGSKSAEGALDAWMATFYHRLPLLNPCLVRIGFGMEDGMAVLDAGSMVNPALAWGWVQWPPHGARHVPCEFLPELPNPVPGEDQAAMGYPITVQYFTRSESARVKSFRLHVGPSAKGRTVDCWVVTPEKPFNLECVPAGAWALIPKRHLKPATTYTAVAAIDNGEPLVWSFKTK